VPYEVIRSGRMIPKDTRLTFRVRSELKKKLELVAASEGRSVARNHRRIGSGGGTMGDD
jgi:hypothetical protein